MRNYNTQYNTPSRKDNVTNIGAFHLQQPLFTQKRYVDPELNCETKVETKKAINRLANENKKTSKFSTPELKTEEKVTPETTANINTNLFKAINEEKCEKLRQKLIALKAEKDEAKLNVSKHIVKPIVKPIVEKVTETIVKLDTQEDEESEIIVKLDPQEDEVSEILVIEDEKSNMKKGFDPKFKKKVFDPELEPTIVKIRDATYNRMKDSGKLKEIKDDMANGLKRKAIIDKYGLTGYMYDKARKDLEI